MHPLSIRTTLLSVFLLLVLFTTNIPADAVVATATTGTEPQAIALDSVTNKIYVANYGSGNVSIIDGTTTTTTSVRSGSNPFALAVNPVTDMVYVANSGGGTVTAINGATGGTSVVGVGSIPFALAVNTVTNKIYVANYGSGTVTVIDGATDTTTTVNTGVHPYALAVNPATNMVYVANAGSDSVTVINGATNATTGIAVGTSPEAIAVDPATNMIYVANYGSGTVTVISGATRATTSVSVGQYPQALAVNPVTDKIYVAAYGSSTNIITIINGATNATTAVSTVWAGPWALAVNGATDKIYIANSESGNVTVLDGTTNLTDTLGVGSTPQAIAVNSLTDKIYVANYKSNTVSVIEGIAAPAAVTLTAPADNAAGVSANVTLKWSAVPAATGYVVQVSTTATFGTTTTNAAPVADSLAVSLGMGTKYYWRVASSDSGGESPWVGDSFTTALPPIAPSAPTIIAPSNGATNVPLNAVLTWNSAKGAASYLVQISTGTSFTSAIDTAVTDTAWETAALPTSTGYFWRVNATNAWGTGPWSTVAGFTTQPGIPGAPLLAGPANAAVNIPMNPVLQWNPVAGASSYEVQLATSSSFTLPPSDTVVTVPQRYAGVLSSFTTYFWRVDAINSYGTGAWSTAFSFTTNGIGVLGRALRIKGPGLGYSGTLAIYSLSGRQVAKVPFTASATREEVLDVAGKLSARGKGLYRYRFLDERTVMDEGSLVVR
jgi:YVTN family beta-propeller protein